MRQGMFIMAEGVEILNEKTDTSPIYLDSIQNSIASMPAASYQCDTAHYHTLSYQIEVSYELVSSDNIPHFATTHDYEQQVSINAPPTCEPHSVQFCNESNNKR